MQLGLILIGLGLLVMLGLSMADKYLTLQIHTMLPTDELFQDFPLRVGFTMTVIGFALYIKSCYKSKPRVRCNSHSY